MWEELKNKLKSILDGNSLIQETFNFEVLEFGGTPSATITSSDNESDYSTTKENIRIYAFNIRLYVDRGGALNDSQSETALTQLVDSVIDDLDKNWDLSGLSNPTGYQFMNLEAIPSSWGYAGREMEYRTAEIKVKCKVVVDTTLIS